MSAPPLPPPRRFDESTTEDLHAHSPITSSVHVPTARIEAAKRGNTELIQECGDQDINYKDTSGSTALHWACRAAHPSCVHALLTLHADNSKIDHRGENVFHCAAHAKKDAVECVRILLEAEGATEVLKGKDRDGKTAADVASGEVRGMLVEAKGNSRKVVRDDVEEDGEESD